MNLFAEAGSVGEDWFWEQTGLMNLCGSRNVKSNCLRKQAGLVKISLVPGGIGQADLWA